MTIRILLAATAISPFLNLTSVVGHAQSVAPFSEVNVIVFDENRAVIPECEIVFRKYSDMRLTVSHTDIDGMATARLQSGTYLVTTTKAGFAKSKLYVQIFSPTWHSIRVVLKVGSTDGDGVKPVDELVPVTTCDPPSAIEPEVNDVPPARPASKRDRPWRCYTYESVPHRNYPN